MGDTHVCFFMAPLRLNTEVSVSIKGGLPRTVPKDGRVLGGHFIPGGFTASTQAYTLHRDPSIFREPLQWNPDRWLQPSQEMKDAYMPYGGGTRGKPIDGLHGSLTEVFVIS